MEGGGGGGGGGQWDGVNGWLCAITAVNLWKTIRVNWWGGGCNSVLFPPSLSFSTGSTLREQFLSFNGRPFFFEFLK